MSTPRDDSFTVYLRVPEWTDANTRISVNGNRVEGDVAPGKFFPVRRTWKNGDRIEYEIAMPLRLKPVDPETLQTVALMRGPIAMFATGGLPATFSRSQLLAATIASKSSGELAVAVKSGKVSFLPFSAVGDQPYRLYHTLES